MRVPADPREVSTRARLVPRGALLDQRRYGHSRYSTSGDSADRVADEERGGVSSKGAAFGLTGGGGKPRGGWALSLDRGGARGAFESDLVRVCGDLAGVSTRARLVPRRALLDQREHGAILDQRDYGALPLLGQRNSASADRVGREERAAVSRSREGLRGLGRGLDTCPARSSRGTTRPAGARGNPRPAGLRGTSATRPAELPIR